MKGVASPVLKLLILGFFFFIFSFSFVLAAPPSSQYYPGETISPSCAPGATNCTVNATSTLNINTDSLVQGVTNFFYTSSLVNAFIHASTTIPKTYTSNTFTGTNIFSGAFTVGSFNGPLQANNGVVSATSSLGVLYGGTGLTSAPSLGYIPVGNSSGGYTLTATTSLGLIAGSIGGADTQVQFNDGGSFAGDSGLTYNKTADRLTTLYASTTALSSSYASSTNLFAGTLSVGALSGFLKATAGSVASSLVDLTSDIIGTLPVGKGGTGSATTFTQGSVLFAGASGVYSQNNSLFSWDNSANRLSVVGTIAGTHLKGLGSAPSIAAGAGAGLGGVAAPIVSITGTDTAGEITLTTGTLPLAANTLLTITFATAYGSTPYVSLVPANAATALLSGVSMVFPTLSTSAITLTSGSTALVTVTQYKWHYMVVE